MIIEKFRPHRKSLVSLVMTAIVSLGMIGPAAPLAVAQDDDASPRSDETSDVDRQADAAAERAVRESDAAQGKEEDKAAQAASDERASLNPLQLLLDGGLLMVPIALMSLVVVLFGVERALGLRRSKVIPGELVDAFGQLAGSQAGFDPRRAYRLCQQHPCAAANVIRAMLLKIGRPHAEVEHTVSEANEREAAKLYSNVRPLNLAAAVTPLIGLLGTVSGMIQAFFATANLEVGQNKGDALAEGIYVALVTTFAGLAVAIPAAVLAHFFEGRIQSLFREVDDLMFNLLPQVERYEGKLRVSRAHLSESAANKGEVPAKSATGESKRQPAAAPASD